MNVETDYYAILGVLPSIDQSALAAVYRALLKKYHPDVHSGDPINANSITRRINEAYEVLGSAASRAEYDRRRKHHRTSSGDFEYNSRRPEGGKDAPDEQLLASWRYIVRYYPEAERHRTALAELDSALSLAFQVTLIETRSAAESQKLSEALKAQFLERYFGTNAAVQEFATEALKMSRRDVALEINKAIKVLGSPRQADAANFIETVKRVTKWGNQSPPSRPSDHGAEARAETNASAQRDAERSWSTVDWVTVIGSILIGVAVFAYIKAM